MAYGEPVFRADRVDTNGIEVSLVGHSRHTSTESWMTFSWRTRLSPGGSNRRFYMHRGEPWGMSTSVALSMLHELNDQHRLSSDPAPTVRPEVLFSTSMTPDMRSRIWTQICLPEDRWSQDVEFVVTQDPYRRNQWRKIGIVDSASGQVAFRSTTLDGTYPPKKIIPSWTDWYLDNSMLDCEGRELGAFLDLLTGTREPMARTLPPVHGHGV
ncbi:hypothetical protein B277_03038 [Janibacter hoylei PVAS-1]|uniref:Uncharacterized protein n=1 Tax=Janibacter hoylei PVAS-1 TaxID=1210046 RepID=K1EA66_9MICO|nr:hypothetical protein [Janibacter hoylei]EKA62267.1 hypothetical protein B277_03038 [Janibacter hoylei PVAS-1]RWU85750.1 hypothetical protein CWN80_01955 [Janibacter hoylei PVAS-1]